MNLVFSHSEALTEIAAALCKAQSQIPNAKKIKDNPHFKSKYADLAELRDISREPLAQNGLCIIQSPSSDGMKISVTTLLLHTSGQWLKGIFTVTSAKDTPQAAGSCVTYLRRYSMEAMLCIVGEGIDDDGNLGTNLSSSGGHQNDRSSNYQSKPRGAYSKPPQAPNPQQPPKEKTVPLFDPTIDAHTAWLDKALAKRNITEIKDCIEATERMVGQPIGPQTIDNVISDMAFARANAEGEGF